MRDIISKIIDKLHTICTSLAGTKTVADGLSETVSALGKTVFSTTVEIAEDTVIAAGNSVEINSAKVSTLIPSGAVFIGGSLKGGTTAGMGKLIIHSMWWGDNEYVGISNPTGSSLTVPAGKVVEIFYAK